MSLLIWGAGGYMGSVIAREAGERGVPWRGGRRDGILQVIQQMKEFKPLLCINAAAFIPMPTVDACKDHQFETIGGNVWWPAVLRDACEVYGVPMMHISTGCLFNEERYYGENETPTRGWDGYCGFYVGTKLLSERIVSHYKEHYILRIRLPFDEFENPRNYISKLASFSKVYRHENSLTHRGDFAKWVLDIYQRKVPYGTYHCTNPGTMDADELVKLMAVNGMIKKMPEFVDCPGTSGAKLSSAKLRLAGVPMRQVEDAVYDSITNWKKL